MFTDAQKSKAALSALFLLTVLNAVFVFGVLCTVKQFVVLPADRTYTYVGDDFPAQLPIDLPPVGIPLAPGTPRFAIDADAEWGTLFPPSDGFTDLGAGNRTFLISMVHQLHCLDIMRVGFATNRTGYHEHVEHCLRYMLQAVLCNADATLEPADVGVLNGRMLYKASGVGSVHQCKDWTVLRGYMEEHPAVPARADEVVR